MQPEPPQSSGPDQASGSWDSLAFGSADPPSPRRRKLVAGLAAAGVVVLAGLAAVQLLPSRPGPEPRIITLTAHPARPSTYLSMDGSTKPLLTGRPLPAAAAAPAGLGADPTFDRLARQCYVGTMHACDELYDVSAPGSRYEAYADTCAGRQPRNTNRYCTAAFAGS